MQKLLFPLLLLLFTHFSYAKEATVPTMSMTDINGTSYTVTGTDEGLTISGLEGKIIFLEFFGYRCPPCLASIPNLIKLQEKYKDKLAIVAIEVQGYDNKQLTDFVKQKGINYIAISSEKAGMVVDYIQQRAQWQGSIPFVVTLDGKGEVQHIKVGMVGYKTLEAMVEQIDSGKK